TSDMAATRWTLQPPSRSSSRPARSAGGTPMAPINVCLVGTGWTAANHRNGYLAIPNKARVAAVVAHSDASRAKADAWGVPRIYRAIEEALADPDVDLIDICTPHYYHAEMAAAALEAGKHVLVETPTCTSAEECRRLRLALFEHPRQKAAT